MTADSSARNVFRKNGVAGLGNNGHGRSLITTANPSGGSSASLLQKQLSFKTPVGSKQMGKSDEIEMIDSSNIENFNNRYNKNSIIGWICCAPCIWLRTSAAVHKMAITSATLLVTTLLVASPILFLISTAPSPLPRDCYMEGDKCSPAVSSPPECTDPICETVASSIQARLNWNKDPCTEFKKFSCWRNTRNKNITNLIEMGNSQKSVDSQMLYLFQNKIMNGSFNILHNLFESCLQQTTNSTVMHRIFDSLGGYLPVGSVGPSRIAPLIAKIYDLGPSPLVDLYYDLSYGRRPHILLIISGPSTSSTILERKIRWMSPKAPPSRIKQGVPKLLADLIDNFLPPSVSYAQRVSEKDTIFEFVKDLNKLQVEHSRRGFWDSTVLYNVSSLQDLYPVLNWTLLIPQNWSGPIVVRNSEYLKALGYFLTKYPTRVAHNSLLLLSALEILPRDYPSPEVCTRSTMWALPELSSALYIAQHSSDDLKDITKRAEIIFKSLKAHLKRAPSLKGAALVKLSALKIQSQTWDGFSNTTDLLNSLQILDITAECWFQNILEIYKKNKVEPTDISLQGGSHDAWAYPIVSTIFYDTLSHSIVSGQELCAESNYLGIDTNAPEFDNILGWLVAQGGSATEVFKCPSGSMINIQKTCNVL
ncbi:uncharacterized protein LOC6499889 isoform X2 [Drosophila ananassae]|uniref:uncharacterized protein LOC6499889 isoform X2 n=1 Tax=Drosophila ananassae TaxID=7217 RepID=UPI0013A5C50F|nr:uncharacterized protein LOC6499889 isoform X2 [Drosophila ananassae]